MTRGPEQDEEGRALLQRRLTLFTRLWAGLMLLTSGALYLIYALYPDSQPAYTTQTQIGTAVAVVVVGGCWVWIHRGPRSVAELHAIDAIGLTVIGAVFGAKAYLSSDIPSGPYLAFLWHIFVVFSRATIVPSAARRTALLTGISFLPLVAAAVAIAIVHGRARTPVAPAPYVAFAAFLCAVATLLATTSAQVIYGLRRQVHDAMRLGQYTLLDRIGEGGMGVVYRAQHALLRRPTAIKLLPVDRSSAAAIARFEREVQQMSRLTHPATVAVYDYGHSLDGVFYYAMEYLDGFDLETAVRRHGPMPPERVAHLLTQVCGSLEEAHAIGLIHRDVKPANVILCRRGLRHDVIKVVDFGLVKDVRAGEPDVTDEITGTPAYLSPEAIIDPARVGPRSDLYAIGAVGYFLLTGQPVFPARSFLELCAMHVKEAPAPPSARLGAPLPAELEALILACLAKDPDDRPASAAALGAALAACPVPAPWTEARAAAWWDEAGAAAVRAAAPDFDAKTLTVSRLVRGR